jgi:DNA replication protein DnaC
MRMPFEVDSFRAEASERDITPGRLAYETAMYEGCVPELYWFVKPTDVQHNKEAFEGVVVPYSKRFSVAFDRGYSLLFTGDNGTGKTLFMSYLLGRAAVRGHRVYYTTLMGLDSDLKRGFGDRAVTSRLREQLDADIVAIDEMGKEQIKRDFLSTQLEAYLKERYDNGYPTLLASNLEYAELCKLYGPTIESMLEGRYQMVALEGGDFRRKVAAKMKADMRYGGK